jgi:hypothetical protein
MLQVGISLALFTVVLSVSTQNQAAAAAQCRRPSNWCTHAGATYKLKDCDGDGIPDPTCVSTGQSGAILSGNKCKDTRGKCGSRKPAAIAKQCPRPSNWCTHAGATYKLKDCDGDGIPDPTCVSTGESGALLSSSKNCKDTWPRGKCVTRKPGSCSGSHLDRANCHEKKANQHNKKKVHHLSQLRKHSSQAKNHKARSKHHKRQQAKFQDLHRVALAKSAKHTANAKTAEKKAVKHYKHFRDYKAKAKRETKAAKSWADKAKKYSRKAGYHGRQANKYKQEAVKAWKRFQKHLKQAKYHSKMRALQEEKHIHHLGEHYMG